MSEHEWVWRQYLVNNAVSDELGRILDKLIKFGTSKRYANVTEILQDLSGKTPSVNPTRQQEIPQPAVPKRQQATPQPTTFEFETVTVDQWGQIIKRENYTASYFRETFPNNIILDSVYIRRSKKFVMGSPAEEGNTSEKPQHRVTVPSFYMGKYPITQAQWAAVACLPKINYDLNPDPSRFKGNDRPVESVSWYEAVEFCDRLSQQTRKPYRLPSESEWEYACRAGTTTLFYFGETITKGLANYDGKYCQSTTCVGQFPRKDSE